MLSLTEQTEYSRIRWQCRRGMLELDELLGDFLEKQYQELTDEERLIFKKVLSYPDQLLFDYFFGNGQPTDKDVSHVIERIRNTHSS